HLFPKYVPAGFLGVDIFFVLSGYLMSSLYGGLTRSTLDTYALSRSRRILPAYFAVLALIVVAAFFIVLPHDYNDVAKHALYSIALIPNIGFWADGSYFDKSIFRPALHFWSLGVELQFYLLFPIVVLLQRRRPMVLLALACLSLVACLFVVGIRPRYAFF